MRGLILAGGTGSRLWPLTWAVSKQLIPVYDKPMIYYPLSALLHAGIREILLISSPWDTPRFQQLLRDGSRWGINLSYAIQPSPDGLAQAFVIGSEFIGAHTSALVLGDNIFYGQRLPETLRNAATLERGAHVFAYQLEDPEGYGVITFGQDGRVNGLEEKPSEPGLMYAVPGLYFYDNTVVERARDLVPSARGELEITDLNCTYLAERRLEVTELGRDMIWLDAGTPDSLFDATKFVEAVQRGQGSKFWCPEEICWRLGYIDDTRLEELAGEFGKADYGQYLKRILDEGRGDPD